VPEEGEVYVMKLLKEGSSRVE